MERFSGRLQIKHCHSFETACSIGTSYLKKANYTQRFHRVHSFLFSGVSASSQG